MNQRVLVSLVTYNGAAVIRACLLSLLQQTARDVSITVFDNASTDTTCDIVRSFSEVTLIVSEVNIGFAAGHNAVIRDSGDASIILCLNQDTVLDRRYIELAREVFLNESRAGAVTGKILSLSEGGSALTQTAISARVDTCGLSLKRGYDMQERCRGMEESAIQTHLQEVFGISAAVGMYRKSALDDCAFMRNGRKEFFDEDFFMYKEDVDLAYRLTLRGWSAYCAPLARAWHQRTGKPEMKRANQMVNWYSYRNGWWVIMKNFPRNLLIRHGVYILFWELGKLIYIVIREPKSLTALFSALRGMGSMMQKRKHTLANQSISDTALHVRLHIT